MMSRRASAGIWGGCDSQRFHNRSFTIKTKLGGIGNNAGIQLLKRRKGGAQVWELRSEVTKAARLSSRKFDRTSAGDVPHAPPLTQHLPIAQQRRLWIVSLLILAVDIDRPAMESSNGHPGIVPRFHALCGVVDCYYSPLSQWPRPSCPIA
jgi:hypothetical protein